MNYVSALRYVFATTRSSGVALSGFFFVAVAGATMNTTLIAVPVAMSLYFMLAQLIATGLVLIVNFTTKKHWTFA